MAKPAGSKANALANAPSKSRVLDSKANHYYKIGLCFRSFVPVTFGPETKCGFCPGSNG